MIKQISIKTKFCWISAYESNGKIFRIRFGKLEKQIKSVVLKNFERNLLGWGCVLGFFLPTTGWVFMQVEFIYFPRKNADCTCSDNLIRVRRNSNLKPHIPLRTTKTASTTVRSKQLKSKYCCGWR